MQRQAAKAAAAAAAANAAQDSAEEEEVVKSFESPSMVKSELTADDSQQFSETAAEEAAPKKARGCLHCKVSACLCMHGCWLSQLSLSRILALAPAQRHTLLRLHGRVMSDRAAAATQPCCTLTARLCVQACQKVPMPPHSDGYNLFLAWIVNKVCLVVVVISYIIASVCIVMLHAEGQVFGAKDALLSYSELSSCEMPGVLPGLPGPCPSAPLAASKL